MQTQCNIVLPSRPRQRKRRRNGTSHQIQLRGVVGIPNKPRGVISIPNKPRRVISIPNKPRRVISIQNKPRGVIGIPIEPHSGVNRSGAANHRIAAPTHPQRIEQ